MEFSGSVGASGLKAISLADWFIFEPAMTGINHIILTADTQICKTKKPPERGFLYNLYFDLN
jgi:hypothetical protein